MNVTDRSLSAMHQYLDDDPTGTSSDMYEVKVTATDVYGFSTDGSAMVTVDNVAPEITFFNVFPSPLDEGGAVTVRRSRHAG